MTFRAINTTQKSTERNNNLFDLLEENICANEIKFLVWDIGIRLSK